MRSRRVLLPLLMAVVVVLAGCATVPTSSPVQTAPPQVEQDDPGIVFRPNPPAENATAENIVRSFIQAASAGRGYDVAKQFLTAAFAKKWNPDAGVIVHTASWSTTQIGDDRVQLRVPISAEVNGDGVYTPSDRSPETLDFQLAQVRGQWRISDGPDGVVLSQPAFLRVFTPASLRFFDADFQRFVPDLRWFPTRTDPAPDIVTALLAGQATPLRSVTRSAFPGSTELLRPVRRSGGRVLVDIVTPDTQPDQRATDRMQQQLAESIGISVSLIGLTTNGRAAPAAKQAELEQLASTGPVVVSKGRFGTLTAQGAVQEDRELGPRIVQLRPAAVTYSAQQNRAAVLTGGGQVVVVSRDSRRFVDPRAGLAAPTMDQQGWTYSVPADDPSAMRVFDSDGRRSPFSADLGGTAVRAIEVSSDGTRLLVLLDTGDGPEAFVYGILRDAKGRPTGLDSNRYPIGLDIAAARDATWVDQSTVAVLTAGGSVQSVIVQQLGGIATTVGGLQDARQVIGATNEADLRVLLGSGAVLIFNRSSTGFALESPASVGVDVLAVQR